jgi:hypothetical protein
MITKSPNFGNIIKSRNDVHTKYSADNGQYPTQLRKSGLACGSEQSCSMPAASNCLVAAVIAHTIMMGFSTLMLDTCSLMHIRAS